MLFVVSASADSWLVACLAVFFMVLDGSPHRPERSTRPAEHAVHKPAPRQRVQPSSHATHTPAEPYSPAAQLVLHLPEATPRGRKRDVVASHDVHAEALAGAAHELQVGWQERHPTLSLCPEAKPGAQAAMHFPRCNIDNSPLGSHPVHANEPGPSQLAQEASQAVHAPVEPRNWPLAQPTEHLPSNPSTGRIHGRGLHAWQSVESVAEHVSQS